MSEKNEICRTDSGARWLRCDLHVHTPFDREKKFGSDIKAAMDALENGYPEKLARIAADFMKACREAAEGEGLDLVAITDHNSIDGYKYLRRYFDSINQQAFKSGKKVVSILPGVELSVGGERPLHFLVIFSADTKMEDIEGAITHIFGARRRFNPQTGTPESTGQSVLDFFNKLWAWCHPDTGDRNLCCVVLPAHADGNRGIGSETGAGSPRASIHSGLWDELKGNIRKLVFTHRDWNGFQTRKPYEELPPEFRNLLNRWRVAQQGRDWEKLDSSEKRGIRDSGHWPLVEASDPATFTDIGKKYTWLKMEVPDVEGIRLSLLDPESRLRRMSDGRPDAGYPVIRRIWIKETDFFPELKMNFNPCLNTLIGGRGSGKSTVIECIRYALHMERSENFEENEEEIKRYVESFLRTKNSRDFGETSGILLPEHSIAVDIDVSGTRYRITRTENGTEIIRDFDTADAENVGFDVRSLIIPRILSQRQISRIAKDSAAQRRELDNLADPEKTGSFHEKRQEILEELEALQVKRRQLKEKESSLPKKETELQKKTDQIAVLEKEGKKEVLDSYNAFRKEMVWIDNLIAGIDERNTSLQKEAEEFAAVYESMGEPPGGPSYDWLRSLYEKTGSRFSEIRQIVESATKSLDDWKDEIIRERKDAWEPKYDDAVFAYEQALEEMRSLGIEFGQHKTLLQSKAILEKQIEELKKLSFKRKEIQNRMESLRNGLIELHEERNRMRHQLSEKLESEDADIQMTVKPFGHKEDLIKKRDDWFSGSGMRHTDWEIIVDYIYSETDSVPDNLMKLVKSLWEDIDKTEEKGRPIAREESQTANLLGNKGGFLSTYFFNALENKERINIEAMERFLPEDAVETKVRDPQGEFKPIEQGSLGLKSTAILSLLLAAGDQPLIIDQPEDDLDNHYVYNVVVDLLRKRKFSRQIIIATHNANIPVNGDAESIFAFIVKDRLGTVGVTGSIDKPEVKNEVSEIMEGSSEAFRLRRKRYGF